MLPARLDSTFTNIGDQLPPPNPLPSTSMFNDKRFNLVNSTILDHFHSFL